MTNGARLSGLSATTKRKYDRLRGILGRMDGAPKEKIQLVQWIDQHLRE